MAPQLSDRRRSRHERHQGGALPAGRHACRRGDRRKCRSAYPAPGVVEQDQEDFYATAAADRAPASSQRERHRPQARSRRSASTARWPGSARSTRISARRRASIPGSTCAASPTSTRCVRDHGDDGHAAHRLSADLRACAPRCCGGSTSGRRNIARIAKFVAPAGYVAGRLAGLKAERRLHRPHVPALHRRRRCESGRMVGRALRAGSASTASGCRGSSRRGRSSARRRPDAARDFGLPPGVPIVAGAGDTAASALGAGIVRPGMLLDVAGTASVLAGCTDRFVADVDEPHAADDALGHARPLASARLYRRRRAGAPLVPRPVRRPGTSAGRATCLMTRWSRRRSTIAARRRRACSSRRISAAASARPIPARRGAWHGFSWGHTPRAFLPLDPRERRLRVRVLSRDPRRPRARARARRGARGRRRREERRSGTRSRPTFSACPTGGLPRADIATWGVAHRRRPRRRPDPRHGGGGRARLRADGDRRSRREPASACRLSAASSSDYIEWQTGLDRDERAAGTAFASA